MAIKYRLVSRKDMAKDAPVGSKLFYAASSSNGMCDLTTLCEIIADRSAATAGDVKLVLDGLMYVVQQKLKEGQTIQLGDLGYFQAHIGSKGAKTTKEFTTDLIKRCRITFRPGKLLQELSKKLRTERDMPKEESTNDRPDEV